MRSTGLRRAVMALAVLTASCASADQLESSAPTEPLALDEATTSAPDATEVDNTTAAPDTTTALDASPAESTTTAQATSAAPITTTTATTAAPTTSAAAAPTTTAAPAPASDLVTLVGGGQLDLNSIEGTDTVLWFWAPW